MDQMNAVRADIIRRHYGQTIVGKESFGVFKYWDILQMGVNLHLTKPNSVTNKKNLFLLFVNNRLVESDKIKRVIDTTYSMY